MEIQVKDSSFHNGEASSFGLNQARECHVLLLQTRETSITSTVYWCIASKLKAPRIFYWMSNMFLWVEIFIFFVCYHVVPKRHSQLDYELNGLWNKIKLKTTRWRWCFWKYLLWLWVWSRLTNWYSSTSDSSGLSVLITELIYWTKTSRVSQLIAWGIFSTQKKICGYQVMATTSNFKFDSINEIFDLSNGMFLTVNNIFHQSVKSSFKMNCWH